MNSKNYVLIIIIIFICCIITSCYSEPTKDIEHVSENNKNNNINEQSEIFENTKETVTKATATTQEIPTTTIKKPLEIIIRVEPENINLDEIPENLIITIENLSDTEWYGGYHCAIDYFNGDDWELILAPAFIDDVFEIKPNSTCTNYVPTEPYTTNYTTGKYRVRFGFNSDGIYEDGWNGWYGIFFIT